MMGYRLGKLFLPEYAADYTVKYDSRHPGIMPERKFIMRTYRHDDDGV